MCKLLKKKMCRIKTNQCDYRRLLPGGIPGPAEFHLEGNHRAQAEQADAKCHHSNAAIPAPRVHRRPPSRRPSNFRLAHFHAQFRLHEHKLRTHGHT